MKEFLLGGMNVGILAVAAARTEDSAQYYTFWTTLPDSIGKKFRNSSYRTVRV